MEVRYMIFRYYFLKEGSRVYDKSELITYLQAQPYVKFLDDGVIKKAIYHNTVLNFEATFVFNNKSIINRIEKLDPKYLDLNLRRISIGRIIHYQSLSFGEDGIFQWGHFSKIISIFLWVAVKKENFDGW